MRYLFEADLWQWSARSNTWTFVSLPVEASEEIRDFAGDVPRGFGSVRVRVRLGGSDWTTSIFPDSTSGTFVLPVKKAVRNSEGLEIGDVTTVDVELLL